MTPNEILAEINKKLVSEGKRPVEILTIIISVSILEALGKVRQEGNRFYGNQN